MLRNSLNRLIFVVALLLVVPLLIQKGMFMDGLMYAAVSKNLAEELGTFWQPFYGQDYFGLPGFYENPPLGIYNLALYFKVFGTAFWVERLFILSMYLLSIYGIWLNLKVILPKSVGRVFWLVLLAWALIPTVFWSYRQNMMEVQMVPILLISNWLMLKALHQEKAFYLNLLLFSLLTLASFLVKGIVGAFLIGAPFAYLIVFGKRRKSLLFGVLNLLILSVIGGLLYQRQDVKDFFYYYLEVRTATRIKHIPTVGSRFWILGELLQQMILPALLMLMAFLFGRKGKKELEAKRLGAWALFFLLLAIGGSFPLMITKVQRPFYLMNSFPFFILAVSLGLAPYIKSLGERLLNGRRAQLILNSLAGVLLIGLFALSTVNWGTYRRDQQIQLDLAELMEFLDYRDQVYVYGQLSTNWSLKAYAVRNEALDLRLLKDGKPLDTPYLISAEEPEASIYMKYQPVKEFESFTLYFAYRP